MKLSNVRKILAVAVILSLIGVVFTSSINANTSNDSELVEITIEFCGLNHSSISVKLTQEQVDRLEELFDDIKMQLDMVETREEAEEIFKHAVIELDEYGLLGGLSVEQVQRLVTRRCQNQRILKLLEKIYYKQVNSGANENYLCLIAGKTSRTIFTGISFTIPYYLALILMLTAHLFYLTKLPMLEKIFTALAVLFYIPSGLLFTLLSFVSFPLHLGGIVTFGYSTADPGDTIFYYSQGWMWIFGGNGIQTWNDSFMGNLHFMRTTYPPEISTYWIGLVGFMGIKIGGGIKRDAFLLGTALKSSFWRQ